MVFFSLNSTKINQNSLHSKHFIGEDQFFLFTSNTITEKGTDITSALQ